MDKQKFQETFSHIHASDKIVTEVLKMKRKTNGSKYRFLRGIAIAACLLMLVAATIVAAPNIYRALGAGHIVTDEELWQTPTDASGNSYSMQRHEIYLSLPIGEGAPTDVSRFYLPQIPETYEQYHGYLYKDNMTVQYRWKAPDSYLYDIAFEQEAGGVVDLAQCADVVWTEPGEEPDAAYVTLGGVEGYLVNGRPVEGISGGRVFYWTDGDYLFRLQAPYNYTDAQLAALIESVREISDIRPYLIGMTEAEKDAKLP